LIGALARSLALFVAFLMVSVRIAQRCSNQVYQLVAVGITTWICAEALNQHLFGAGVVGRHRGAVAVSSPTAARH